MKKILWVPILASLVLLVGCSKASLNQNGQNAYFSLQETGETVLFISKMAFEGIEIWFEMEGFDPVFSVPDNVLKIECEIEGKKVIALAKTNGTFSGNEQFLALQGVPKEQISIKDVKVITEIGPVSLTQRALDGFSVLDSSLQVNEEGSILIRGKNITNLSAFEFWLTYDSTKFEFVSELGGSKVEFLGPIVAFLKIVSEPDANTLVISGASENGAVQLVDEDIIQINIRAKTSEGKSPLLFGEQSTALDASGNPMDVSFHSGFLSIGDQSLPFLLGDFDQNEQVELNDLTLFSNKYLTQMGDVDFNGIYDIGPAQNTFSNGWEQIIDTPFPDGQVDVQDFFVLGQNYLRTKPSDNPLVAPTTPVPADGASEVEQVPTLSWTHDNSAGGITYDVYLGTSATPPLIQEGLTAKEYQASGLESGVTYYWKVVAKDAEGEAGSETWSFQTAVEIPFSEEGLQLWLAADKIEGLADGAAVGTWNDLSGNGRNAVQGSATLKPVYKTGVINGKPAIRFSGGRYLDTTLIPAVGAGARTLIAVIKNGVKASGSSAEMILHYGEDQTGKAYGLAFKKLGTNKIGTDHWNNGLESGMDCTTESLILQSVYTGTQDIMYINGEESGRGTFALNTGNESPLRVGKIITIPNFYYTGDIAEVIVYGRAITDSERREIEAYLAGKYGIEVESSTDPALKMPDLTVGRSSPFTLGITAKNLQQVSGFTIELNFDPTRIGIDTSVGSLDGLVQFLAPFSGGLKIVQQPDAGTLLINCALMSPEGVDVTSAEIVQVKLQGEGITGTSQVMFGDDTLILDESSNPIVTDISDAGNVTLN